MRFRTLLWRCLRLRCPHCGKGKLFRDFLRMHETCSECGVKWEREAGFFLGSIYFNYGLTALIVAVTYPVLMFNQVLSDNWLVVLTLAIAILFPLWFFRYARSLWIGFDEYFDPRP
ncbi:DUF983 domain-containing protein [Lignipirellula cremea]|uniref:DUF983 domain-containing protein n=1 Tax=Lignipirellula cremea TaxID=2528010 RepID=A0A518DNI6_9BACT|nr:DUF983 domain-containing protein [Lignipirellula cremea]QDU93400.1 hypothetical protein Pla8534_11800 [Lignipirellula cremea]